jgi:hypothetical protein
LHDSRRDCLGATNRQSWIGNIDTVKSADEMSVKECESAHIFREIGALLASAVAQLWPGNKAHPGPCRLRRAEWFAHALRLALIGLLDVVFNEFEEVVFGRRGRFFRFRRCLEVLGYGVIEFALVRGDPLDHSGGALRALRL